MKKFILDNTWYEMGDKQFYQLFEPNSLISPMPVPGRTDPITLDNGTVVTATDAKKGLLTIAIQEHLDAAAQAKGYDNIHSAAIRAGFTGPFQAEGQAFATWMDACWAAAIQVLTDFDNEVIAELPAISAAIAALPPAPV